MTNRPTPIRMVSVNLGPCAIEIPIAVIHGRRPGRTMLVTGGMDGDEYAGITAAYAIVDRFADGNFDGKLIVVPVVNVQGFHAECSQNPIDQKFPKIVFPGKIDGTPTERLVHWLVSGNAYHADAWIDLHGGAITEGVQPFLWLFESGVESVDGLAREYMRSAEARTILFESVGPQSKAVTLAAKGCLYVMAESGARGSRDAVDVERHVGWAVALMGCLGMIERRSEKPRESQPVMLRRAVILTAPEDGIWMPSERSGSEVRTGDPIGRRVRLDGVGSEEIVAPTHGEMLWWKQTMALRKGDVLAAIGTGFVAGR